MALIFAYRNLSEDTVSREGHIKHFESCMRAGCTTKATRLVRFSRITLIDYNTVQPII
jgi:hypothetical protein